jgi:DedD protein
MENRLKERLTGAAILVALVVMLVPEMFHGQRGEVAPTAGSSGEGPPERSITIDLSNGATRAGPLQSTPASGSAAYQPIPLPRSEQPAAPKIIAPPGAGSANRPAPTPPVSASPVTEPPVTAAPAAAAPASVWADTEEHAAAAPQADAPPAPKALAPAPAANSHSSTAVPSHAAAPGGWSVQLGLFANRDNAERLMRSAQAMGFAVRVSNADAKGRYRVYASGMADRVAAEAYAQRLKEQGLSAAVVTAP